MSHEILLEELRRKSAKRVAAIRCRAEQEAESVRTAREREFAEKQKGLLLRIEQQGRKAAAAVIREAEKKALLKLDEGRRQIADRLLDLALRQLGQVRHGDYERMFAELITELPDVAWEKVRVNPLDVKLAGAGFPGAEVEADGTITGGFAVESDDGRFRVVSTLRERLLKAWPFVLPLLMQKIEEEGNAHHAG